MGFNAAQELDVLDYDFEPYAPEAKGITPEPSSTKVLNYQRAVKDAMSIVVNTVASREKTADPDNPTVEDLQFALSAERDQESNEVLEALIKATAEVCSNKPSAAQIRKLPWRVQQHYLGYIAGKFLRGEALTPATNP